MRRHPGASVYRCCGFLGHASSAFARPHSPFEAMPAMLTIP